MKDTARMRAIRSAPRLSKRTAQSFLRTRRKRPGAPHRKTPPPDARPEAAADTAGCLPAAVYMQRLPHHPAGGAADAGYQVRALRPIRRANICLRFISEGPSSATALSK